MDEAQIYLALQNSNNADANIRNTGETYLTSLSGQSGFLPALVKIATSGTEPTSSLMAGILLKNQIKKWAQCAPDDQAWIRANLLAVFCQTADEKIRAMWAESVNILSKEIFPQQWPEVIEQLRLGLASEEIQTLITSLTVLYQITRNYKYIDNDTRVNLHSLVSTFFPMLEAILSKLSPDSEFTPTIEFLALKCYWVSIYLPTTNDPVDPASFARWMTYLSSITARDLIETQWKTKTLSVKILHRLLQRFTHEDMDECQEPLAKYFLRDIAHPILNNIIATLNKSMEMPIPNELTVALIKYLTASLSDKKLKETLKPILESLILNFMIKSFHKTPVHEDLWQNDPVEYINLDKGSDKSIGSAATDFIEALVEDNVYLTFLVEYIGKELGTCTDLVRKEALLYCLGSLKDQIDNNMLYQYTIEDILAKHVRQELKSTVGVLRARAIWIYAKYATYGIEKDDHRVEVIQNICSNLSNEQLPISIEAAIALPLILDWVETESYVEPNLGQVLVQYVKLMEQIDNEELVDALDGVVEEFGEKIAPHAVALIQFLVQSFGRLVEGSEMIAVGLLTTLNKVIGSCKEKTNFVTDLAPLLAPVLHHCLSNAGSTYMEEGISALEICLDKGTADATWASQFYPYLYRSQLGTSEYEAYGNEQFTKLLPVFALYFYKYPQVILNSVDDQGQNYLAQTFAMIQKYFNGDDNSDVRISAKILMCILECFKGQIDSYAQLIPAMGMNKLSMEKSKSIQNVCLQLLGLAMWYDPNLADNTALQLIQSHSHVLKECVDKKRVVMGLLNLCEFNREFYSHAWVMQFVAEAVKYILENDADDSTENDEDSDSDEDSDEDWEPKKEDGSVDSDELNDEENFDSPLNEIDPVKFSRDLLYNQERYGLIPGEAKVVLEEVWATLN